MTLTNSPLHLVLAAVLATYDKIPEFLNSAPIEHGTFDDVGRKAIQPTLC